MQTIRLIPETVHASNHQLALASTQTRTELQALRAATQQLHYAWQGGASKQFATEMQELLRRLDVQVQELELLTSRLQREITEWEETDQHGAALMREGVMTAAWLADSTSLPATAGGLTVLAGFATPILPMMLALSVGHWVGDLPGWLKDWLSKVFPPEPVTVPEPQPPAKSPFGRLLEQPPPGKPSLDDPAAVPDSTPADPSLEKPAPQETSATGPPYSVPLRSQGDLYGNAACSPTSVSMVLDYYHNQDSSLKTASPETLIGMLDPGDGTHGKGMSLSNLTDELADLGYNNVSQQVNANFDTLQTQLKDGPVIVTTGVSLAGPGTLSADVPRAILGSGSTTHAMVVTDISDGNISVNDPWSGKSLSYTQEEFDAIWAGGSRGLYVIRP